MKKKYKLLCAIGLVFVFLFVCVSFFACKQNKDNLFKLGQGLSNYYLDIEYDNQTKTANALCEIDYCNTTESMLKEVKLHLYIASWVKTSTTKVVNDINFDSCFYNGESFATLNISRVQLNDCDIMPIYENEDDDIMVINLNSSLYPTERVNIKIEYAFSLPNCNHRFGYGENTINFGNFYPIACVYNNGWKTDGYSATGDPFYSDMANYNVSICCDKNLTLASTGEIKNSTTDEENGYYNIEARCVRDFAFVLSSKFNVLTKTENNITYNYYYIFDENAERSINCAIDAITLFSKKFYEYPYSSYSVVEADFCYGGMEYPNLSIISNDITNHDDYLNVIVHETAHQWWYNLIGNDEYNEPWLDESLTEFSTILFYDNFDNYNFNHADMVNACHQNFVFYQNVFTDTMGYLDSSMRRSVDDYSTEVEYTFTVYVKGVLMYDSLYNLIGKNNFYKALKLYAKNNVYKNSCEANLISCFEETYKSSLENFFDCWLSGKVIIN